MLLLGRDGWADIVSSRLFMLFRPGGGRHRLLFPNRECGSILRTTRTSQAGQPHQPCLYVSRAMLANNPCRLFCCSSDSPRLLPNGVLLIPGLLTLTRMPRGASSTARVWFRCRWVRAWGSLPFRRLAPVLACRYTPGCSSLCHFER